MARNRADDAYKEKFRPDADAKLDAQIDAALGGISIDDLYGFNKPQAAGGRRKRRRNAAGSFPSIRTMSSSISAARARGSFR